MILYPASKRWFYLLDMEAKWRYFSDKNQDNVFLAGLHKRNSVFRQKENDPS